MKRIIESDTSSKNYTRFWLLTEYDSEFAKKVKEIRDRWKIEIVNNSEPSSENSRKILSSFYNEKLLIGTLNPKGKFRFNFQDWEKEITDFINYFNFGREWNQTIELYILVNVIIPPSVNASVYAKKIGQRDRIIIETNEFTDEIDMKNIIKKYRVLRKDTYPLYNKLHHKRKNTMRDANILKRSIINSIVAVEKGYNKSVREKLGLTDSGIAEIFLGKVDLETITLKKDSQRNDVVKKARKNILKYITLLTRLRHRG